MHLVRADGDRVLVLEPNESRVTIWTPEGSLLLDRERRGAGPGEFIGPYRVHLGASSFRVRDTQRFTELSYDGEVLSTAPNPPTSVSFQGFRIKAEAHLSDGSYMGVAELPTRVELGLDGDDPVDQIPVYHIRETDQGWTLDEIYRLDQANATFHMKPREGDRSPLVTAQPLSDQDLHEVDLGTGTLVVVRRKGGAGLIEVLEIAAGGDTLWRRQDTVAPIPITPEQVAWYADQRTEMFERFVSRMPGGLSGTSDLREKVVEAMYVPESGYFPPVRRLMLSSSGHVWLSIREDTLPVWYSFPRGDCGVARPRRRPQGASSISTRYWKPEQPPGNNPSRRPTPGPPLCSFTSRASPWQGASQYRVMDDVAGGGRPRGGVGAEKCRPPDGARNAV